jgi:hypothetical protein
MAVNRRMTPIDHYYEEYTHTMVAIMGSGEAGSFNGTTTTAATTADHAEAFNDRYHIMRFWDGFTDGGIFNHTLKGRYVAGEQVEVSIVWTTDSSTTGSAYLEGGLTQIGGDTIYGDDSDSEYITFTTYTGPTSTQELITTTFTFSGSGLNPGEPLAFILMRNAISASDTLSDEFKLLTVRWKYNVSKYGETSA